MEHCHFDECQQNISVSYTCPECQHIFCETHKKIENHDCLNPKHNYKNKNKKTESPSIDEINNEIKSFELSDNDNEILKCRYEECNQTSDNAILIKCDTCKRSYCKSHRNMDDHNCKNIKFTLKERAINKGYWECKKCTYMNAPSSKKCMVCQLHDENNTLSDNDSCPYCNNIISNFSREIHLAKCENKFINHETETIDSEFDEIVCPYCKRAMYQCIYDYHIKKCMRESIMKDINYNKSDKFNKSGGIEMDKNKENEVKLYCDQCKTYLPYKVYDFHITWCKGEVKVTDKCSVCKKLIPKQIYDKHLETCYAAKDKSKVGMNKKQTGLNENDLGKFCPVCCALIPNKRYEKHLKKCYTEKDKKDGVKARKMERKIEKQKCPICKKLISQNYGIHLDECYRKKDKKDKKNRMRKNNIDIDLSNGYEKRERIKPIFSGRTSSKMPSTNNISKGNIKGRFIRNRSGDNEKHLWRQTVRKPVPRKKKYKSLFDGNSINNGPRLKKRKIDNENDIYLKIKNPYHEQTLLYLKDLKNNMDEDNKMETDEDNKMETDEDNKMETDEDIKCYWMMAKQYQHAQILFKITENDYKILKNNKDLNEKMIDFMLKYIYSGWLKLFKNRVYIFRSTFYREELIDINPNKDENNIITYYDFLFDKDFIIIPKWNEFTNCWEIIIICYHKNIKIKRGKEKPCIVVWDVLQIHNKGKTKTNKIIRKWLDLQYKYNNLNKDKKEDIFTANTLKAFNTVKIAKLMGERYNNESGCYQLLNFKKWGNMAGYKNTVSNAKLDEIEFGFKQVKEYKQEIVSIIDSLHKNQESYL